MPAACARAFSQAPDRLAHRIRYRSLQSGPWPSSLQWPRDTPKCRKTAGWQCPSPRIRTPTGYRGRATRRVPTPPRRLRNALRGRACRCNQWRSSAFVVCLVHLVCFVYLVDFVHLVSFVQPKKPDRPEQPARSRDSRATVCGADHSQYMQSFSVMISNNLTSPDTPLHTAVRLQDAMFKRHIGALRLQRVAHREHNDLTIVRVDECEQFVLRAANRSKRHAEEPVDLRGPIDLIGLEVPIPRTHLCRG